MNKLIPVKEAIGHIKDGDVVMVGGFLQGGCPDYLVGALISESAAKDLTIVSNDTGWQHMNTYKLMELGRVKKVHSTWIGGNPLTGQMYIDDPATCILTPQGTLAESIRAAGCGIPAFLSPVGVGTVWQEGKELVKLDGRDYILERALFGDVALIHATVADEFGNCFMRGATKNFNVLMPAACKYTIVEAEKVVKVGELDPELVMVSGINVHAVIAL